ncbi:MAG: hypothetical protein FJW31_11840 [Acidobacteria bacterium]|nr:hypothetical protein [Acidobacteriota bacterium]
MFFRREKIKAPSFSDRLGDLTGAGFQTQSIANGRTLVTRMGVGAEVTEGGEPGTVNVGKAGVIVSNELGQLTDVGYQKVFVTASGKKVAARAEHLRALHDFTEDLRETLGMTSLYNQGLGSTNELHLYDRVEDRDGGAPKRPWEHAK